MDLRNIIQPISPAQLRLYQTRHDLLHELIKDEKHIIFYHKDFKDGSCVICEQEPTHNVTARNRPLHQWIESGNIIPSWKTFAQFITMEFHNLAHRRKENNIRQILCLCRYRKYPLTWDYTIERLECCLNGKDIPYQEDDFLDNYSKEEIDAIRDGLACDLRVKYQLETTYSPPYDPTEAFEKFNEYHSNESGIQTPTPQPQYYTPSSQLIETSLPSRQGTPTHWQLYAANPNRSQESAEEVARTVETIERTTSRSPISMSTTTLVSSFQRDSPMEITGETPRIFNREETSSIFSPMPEAIATPSKLIIDMYRQMQNAVNAIGEIEKEMVAVFAEFNDPLPDVTKQTESEIMEFEQTSHISESSAFIQNVHTKGVTYLDNENSGKGHTQTELVSEKNIENNEYEIDYQGKRTAKTNKGKNVVRDNSEISESSQTTPLPEVFDTTVLPPNVIKTLPPPTTSTHKSSSENKNLTDNPDKPPETYTQTKVFDPPKIITPIKNPDPKQKTPSPKKPILAMEQGQLNQFLQNLTQSLQQVQINVPTADAEQNIRNYDIAFIEGKTHPRKFLMEMEKRFNANKVDDFKRRIKILCSLVAYPVAEWIDNWVAQHNSGKWYDNHTKADSFFDQFVKQYITSQFRKKLTREYNELALKKDQTVADYAMKLREYWNDLGLKPNDITQVDRFIQGLPAQMKMVIYQQGEPQDFDEARQRATNAELARMYDEEDNSNDHKGMVMLIEKLDELQRTVASASTSTPTSSKTPQVYMAERAPVDNQGRPRRNFNNNNNGNYRNNRQSNARDVRTIQCYGCGNFGHYKRDCRSKCTKCGKTGHFAKNCSVQPAPKNY